MHQGRFEYRVEFFEGDRLLQIHRCGREQLFFVHRDVPTLRDFLFDGQ